MALVMLFCVLAAHPPQDENREPLNWDLKFTYDFSYPGVLSREEISNGAFLASDLINRPTAAGFRAAYEDPDAMMGPMFMAGFVIASLFEIPLVMTEHEYGHFQAYSRAGYKQFVFIDGWNGSVHPFEPQDAWQAFKNMFDQWHHGEQWLVSIDSTEWWAKLQTDLVFRSHYYEFEAITEAGGMNQNQYSLELLSDRIKEGRAHILDGLGWFVRLNATLAYAYPAENGDIDGYLEDMEILGISASGGTLKNVQWFKYLSGSSLAMWTGLYHFVANGKDWVGPLPEYLPEFASYLTTHGVTMKVRNWVISGGNIIWEPSIQWSLDADSQEFGIRMLNKSNNLLRYSFSFFVHDSGGIWYENQLTFSLLPWLEIGLGATHGRNYTFEREIAGKTFSFLEENEFSLKGMLGINLTF